MAMPSYRSSLVASVSSALVAAVLVSLADAALTLGRSFDLVRGATTLRVVFGTVALYVLAALVLSIIEGVIAGAVALTLPPGSGGRLRTRIDDDPSTDTAVAGGILAAAFVALLHVGGVTLYHLSIASGMSRPLNAALSTGLMSVVFVSVATFLWFPCFRVARHVVRILPRSRRLPRTLTLAVLLLLMGVGAAVVFLGTLDWRVIDFGPFWTAGAFVLCQVGALLVRRRFREALEHRASLRRWGFVVSLALALGLAPVLAHALVTDESAMDLIVRHSSGAKSLARVPRLLRGGNGRLKTALASRANLEEDDFAPSPARGQSPRGSALRPNRANKASTEQPSLPNGSPQERPGQPSDVSKRGSKVPFNVLLVTIDAVRADRLGFAKYRRPLTPNIDRLQQRSVYFSRTYAQAPNTPRSFPSFVTARPPSRVKWVKEFANFSPITPENHMWFEELSAAGVRTIGIFSHFYFTPERGIGRGFAEWDNEGALSLAESNTDIAAPRIIPKVVRRLEQLAASKERFLLWTYLFEPHSRYMVHKEFPVKSSGLPGLEEKYDYEIAFVDKWLAPVFEALERTHLDKNTIVVVHSDHGEGFGEHRHYFHGQSVYQEMIHVPLIVSVPGLQPRVVSEPVALMDVGPTLLDLLGIASRRTAPPDDLTFGRSVAPLVRGESVPPKPVPAELLPAPSWNHHARAVIDSDGRWKAIYRVSDGMWELYDLTRDPKEQRNLFHVEREQAQRMKGLVMRLMGADSGPGPKP